MPVLAQIGSTPIRPFRSLRRRVSVWLDYLAPRCCAVCALALTPGTVTGLCPGCLLALPGALRPRCMRCAQPLTEHGGPLDRSPAQAAPSAPATRTTPGCAHCTSQLWFIDQTLAAADYAAPLDRVIIALKFGRQLPLARPLGELLGVCWRGALAPAPLDCLVPVPLSELRLAQRGFNQSLELARAMRAGSAPHLPIHRGVLRRQRNTTAQTNLALHERQANVRGAFVTTQRLDGWRIGLIDDVMTTGNTLNEAARALKDAGAQCVVALVVARTP